MSEPPIEVWECAKCGLEVLGNPGAPNARVRVPGFKCDECDGLLDRAGVFTAEQVNDPEFWHARAQERAKSQSP